MRPAFAPHRCAYCASTSSRLTVDGDGDPVCIDGEGCAAARGTLSLAEQVRHADTFDSRPRCRESCCWELVERAGMFCGPHGELRAEREVAA